MRIYLRILPSNRVCPSPDPVIQVCKIPNLPPTSSDRRPHQMGDLQVAFPIARAMTRPEAPETKPCRDRRIKHGILVREEASTLSTRALISMLRAMERETSSRSRLPARAMTAGQAFVFPCKP